MKRRNFIIATITSLALFERFTLKSKAASIKLPFPGENAPSKISSTEESHYILTRSQSISLPTEPIPIETVIHFKVLSTKWSKGPTLLTGGIKVNGDVKDIITVKNEINLNKSNEFTLQYMGESIGWNIFA